MNTPERLIYTQNDKFIYSFEIRFGLPVPLWIKKSSIKMIKPYRMEPTDKLFKEIFYNFEEFADTTCSSVKVKDDWYFVARSPTEIMEDLNK